MVQVVFVLPFQNIHLTWSFGCYLSSHILRISMTSKNKILLQVPSQEPATSSNSLIHTSNHGIKFKFNILPDNNILKSYKTSGEIVVIYTNPFQPTDT